MGHNDTLAIGALLRRHGFHFSRSMGQNFLIDPDIPAAIAESSQAEEKNGVLEIGPGIGALSHELCKRAGKVVAVELDRTLLPILSETMANFSNFEVVNADILKTDIPALVREKLDGLTPIVCANLPYNITTPVLTKFVETPAIETVTVLIQKEVAQRLSAPQGSSDGGSFSLFLQYHMETEYLFDVPPEKFLPAPKVTSAVLRCVRREKPAVEVADEDFFFKVVRGAFLLRRKTLVNSLAAALPGYGKEDIREAIVSCGLSPEVRGERLTLADFARLAGALESR